MGDGGDQVLEGSGGGESAEEAVNGTMEDLVREISGEMLLEEADSREPVFLETETPSSNVDEGLEPTIDPPLIQIPTEPSSSSEANPSLH